MKSPLHILHLEDDSHDATLIQAALDSEGIICVMTCVQNRIEFVAALERGGVDLVLSDFSLPSFDGLSAAEIVRARWPALPLILVSGTLGEDLAIDSIRGGATDYVLKDRLGRLAPAVRRAMQEVEERDERQRAEKRMLSELHFSEASLNSLPGIFYLFDQEGKFLRWNKNFEGVSGYNSAELSGMRPGDFFGSEEQDYISGKIEKVFSEGAVNAEAHFTARNGTRTPYYFTGKRIQIEGKACLIGTGVDISERKNLEAQFIEAQKMEVVGQLASGVAHDFNNILAVIMGYTDLVVSHLEPGNPALDYVEEIKLASERAVGLTRQLLLFSRNETVVPVVLDLNEVVEKLQPMLQRLVGENLAMTFTPEKPIGRVKADPGYLGQLLMNLVVNARDAMPNGGNLSIATRNITVTENITHSPRDAIPRGEYITLSVCDTGTGMTEEVKARLFEAFFTTKAKGKGTGLGMATCQTIVQQSEGHIVVQSELGKGTTFEVYLPRVEQPIAVGAASTQARSSPRGTETLLLVEDDPAVRHLARGALEGFGYKILSASNGQEALNLTRDHPGAPIRLVITDVVMPVMGGKVMADWLKLDFPDLKLLFTSGYTDDSVTHRGMLDTGAEFLAKPYTPATLARKVRTMLDSKNAERAKKPVENSKGHGE